MSSTEVDCVPTCSRTGGGGGGGGGILHQLPRLPRPHFTSLSVPKSSSFLYFTVGRPDDLLRTILNIRCGYGQKVAIV